MSKIYINDVGEYNINATFKARSDVSTIVNGMEDFKTIYFRNTVENKLIGLVNRTKSILSTVTKFKQNDIVYFNYPLGRVYLGYLSFLQRYRGIKLVPIVHDLDSLRGNSNSNDSFLSQCDAVIGHNDSMATYMTKELGVKEDRIANNFIFDYCYTKKIPFHQGNTSGKLDNIIFTGNLSPEKSGFVYHSLDGVSLDLWGGGYKEESQGGRYIGKFDSGDPSSLVNHYENKNILGLIWDGPDLNTCSGKMGEYLRFNNPHKTSFYLSLGIPVIIWRHAAMAKFITENNCGIIIDSLSDVPSVIDNYTKYLDIKECALEVAKKLRTGNFLRDAIGKTNN